MQDTARVVIAGCGIAGASIACHLARLGRRDVVVVEQGELVGGTTSHAPGLVGQLRSSPTLARMLMYSVSLINEARAGGVVFYPHTRVDGVEVVDGAVRAVQTSAGRIQTETLVVCAGIWSPLLGRMAGVSLPLTPMQHQYAMTVPLPELA